jgi:hypothetical protein
MMLRRVNLLIVQIMVILHLIIDARVRLMLLLYVMDGIGPSGWAELSMEDDPSIQSTHYVAITLAAASSEKSSESITSSNGIYQVFDSVSQLSQLPSSPLAWAQFDPTMGTLGWDILTVTTSPSFTDTQQAYAAGYVEGWSTRVRIQQWWAKNRASESYDDETWRRLHLWMNTQIDFIQQQVALYQSTSVYWRQVSLIMQQLNGIVDGINDGMAASNVSAQAEVHTFSLYDIFMINSDGDIEDISMYLICPLHH